MPFVLDTDHITLFQAGHLLIQSRLKAIADQDLFVTIVSYEEQTQGWLAQIHRAKTPAKVIRGYQALQQTLQFFATQHILAFDEAAALYFEQLQQQRIRIGTQDLRIAAIALANRYTVVTRNLRDFERIPGLRVEDWSVKAE